MHLFLLLSISLKLPLNSYRVIWDDHTHTEKKTLIKLKYYFSWKGSLKCKIKKIHLKQYNNNTPLEKCQEFEWVREATFKKKWAKLESFLGD